MSVSSQRLYCAVTMLDIANLGLLLGKLLAVDDLDCGEVGQDVKEDVEKCFNMLKVLAQYINDKVVKLRTQEFNELIAKKQEINLEDENDHFYANVENAEKIESEKYEVVVEQLYENWNAKPNDATTELIVKDVSDDVENFNIHNVNDLDAKEETLTDITNFYPNEVLKKKSRGRPRTSTGTRHPSKIIQFNPKWTNPEKWVKFVDQNGDRICWYIKEVEHNPFVAFCSVCQTEIRIDNGGLNSIKLHAGTKKHRRDIEHRRDSFNPGFKRSWFM